MPRQNALNVSLVSGRASTPLRAGPRGLAAPINGSAPRARRRLVSTFLQWVQARRNWLLAAVALVIGLLLIVAVRDVLREVRYEEVVAAIRETAAPQIVLALLATLASYLLLTGYDRSALQYVGAAVPYRITAPTAFIAFALANNVGFGMLTGGAVRMRLYGAAGVEAGAISRAIGFIAAAFGIGLVSVGAAAILWSADDAAPIVHLPAPALRAAAIVVLAAVAVLLWRCALGRPLRLGRGRGRSLPLPSLGLAARQLAYSVGDIAASASTLWLLLPADSVSLPVFIGFYAIAIVLGMVSHVPGGLGVFEAVILVALAGHVPPEKLAGALVLYRLIYYVTPLALALALLSAYELRRARASPVGRAAESLSPLLLAAFTFVVGIMLLVSGVTPATNEANNLLAAHVPLPLVEASHFLGSVAGLSLLLVARGMLLRLDAAWWAGVVLAAISFVLAVPKGFALSEAAVLAFLLAVLLLSRRQFTRRASLLADVFSGRWLLAVAAALVAITWLLFFVYQDIDYAHDLWWRFELNAEAPRALRALVGVALLLLMFALRALLRPPPPALAAPTVADLDHAERIIRAQDFAEAGVALLGDKYLMFSESGRSFVMFGVRGRSWVALFDPFGPQNERAELVWRFLDRARRSGGRASFYQVHSQTLPLYLDAGLRLFKLGEDAFVHLADFSLKGSRRGSLRHAVNRADRDGLTFAVIPSAEVHPLLPDLRRISDAWLAEHNVAEKRFSIGSFDAEYVCRQPVAVIYQNSAIVAFATLMTTATLADASIDLMRYSPAAPPGTMDVLFVKLMLYFQAAGYRRFDLGMAPLSGMAQHPLAPRWHRAARLLFRHGEHFYNFRGLRTFKEKFDPEWEPRYLASQGGMTPLLVLTDVAAMIAGGLKAVLVK